MTISANNIAFPKNAAASGNRLMAVCHEGCERHDMKMANHHQRGYSTVLRILCVWLAAAALTTATVSAAPDAQQAFQQAYLKASNTRASDRFGGSVAVSGDTMVIANGIGNNSPDSGTAYVFVRSGTNWIPQASLKAPCRF